MQREEITTLDDDTLKSLAEDAGVEFGEGTPRASIEDALFKAYNGAPVDEGDDVAEVPGLTVLTAEQIEHQAAGQVVNTEPGGGLPPPIVADPAKAPAELAKQPDQPIEAPKHHTATQTVMNKPPESASWPQSHQQVLDALKSQIDRGLKVKFTDNGTCWQFDMDRRQAAGNLKMPLKQIVSQANLLFVRTAEPTEGDDMGEILEIRRKQMERKRG